MCHFVIKLKGGETMRTALKQFRIGLHLKQSEIAKILGVCRTTYGFVELGKRSGTAEFWGNLQKAFNVPDEQMWLLQKLDESEDKSCEENAR